MRENRDALRNSAISNALSAVRRGERFPKNVFAHAWDNYLFFESDMVFDRNFIEFKNVVLREEAASVVALVNLGNAQNNPDPEPRSLLLDESTTFSEYFSILKGDGSPLNWIFLMDRYVSASDKGQWCIYCERENDVAVVAVRNNFSPGTLVELRALLNADPISAISESSKSYGFNFDKLVPSWRSSLAAEYAPSDNS